MILDTMTKTEIRTIYKDKVGEFTEMLKETREYYFSKNFNEVETELIKGQIEFYKTQVRKWQNKLNTNVIPIALNKIKERPISEVLNIEPVYRCDKYDKYLCPVHNEKTASFYHYKDRNIYHCYGCGFHGDIIQLYMTLNNRTFSEAIRELS